MTNEHEHIPELQLEEVKPDKTNDDKLRELERKMDLIIKEVKQRKITNSSV